MSTTLVLTKTDLTEDLENQVNGQAENEEELATREAELFEFDNCSKGLGIKICGGCSQDGEELYGVFIKRVLPGGLADIEEGLQKGDQILEVNGDSLEGVTNERAVSILRLACASNHVEMVVTRDQLAVKEFSEIIEKTNGRSVPCTPVPSDANQPKLIPDIIRKLSVNSTDNQNHATAALPNTEGFSLQNVPTTHVPIINGGATPKSTLRGLIPSMSSTPNTRESTATGSSGSTGHQFTPHMEPSPVGHPLSFANITHPSETSVFDNTTASRKPHMSISRKLSLDPHVRLKVEKLNAALRYLGLEPSIEQETRMHSKLKIDPSGTVKYGDFVEVVKDVFHLELKDKNISQGAMMFAAGDITSIMEPPAFRLEMNGGASGASQDNLEQENEELKQENMRLQVLLREKEDEILRIRKEAQGAIQEQRTLRSKVHLAAEAQKAARDMEHDYEEVVHLLENEIARLKLQLGHQVEADPIMQRRLAVLTCQLRKAESERETYKVATEKLLQFTENVHETLNENVSGAKSRPLLGGVSKINTGFLGKHKRATPPTKVISSEAKEITTAVRSMIDKQPLPFGWEETYTADGMKYYINHLNQITTWSHPLSNVTHLPTTSSSTEERDQHESEPKPSGSQD